MAKKKHSASVKINSGLLERLRHISKVSGVSLTWMLNKAVSEWLADYDKRPEVKP